MSDNNFTTYAGRHQLVVIEPGRNPQNYELNSGDIIGRVGGANNIPVSSGTVSSQHGLFSLAGAYGTYTDLGSLNGSYINGRKITAAPRQPSETVTIKDGDVISIAPNDKNNRVFCIFSYGTNGYQWNKLPISSADRITIGRDDRNNIVVPDVTASRNHAAVKMTPTGPVIEDLNSVNGTILNGSVLKGKASLKDGDLIKIATMKIYFLENNLIYSTSAATRSKFNNNNVRREPRPNNKDNVKAKEVKNPCFGRDGGNSIEVCNVSRTVKCKPGTGANGGNTKKILDDISLKIEAGELVAILGGSGAGKTTFMNCVNGFEPADQGTVLIDGTELVKDGKLLNYNVMKSKMGYVPQQDIVHDNLTLRDMLTYTGKLRLPKDTTKKEIDERVAGVIDLLDLQKQSETMIKQLSGGQKKRASIAVELLSDPPVMFLDEPTSGLDPEAETNLMHNLQNMSRGQGKTVIVITHTLQNIRLFDKVIFLAPGGKLCFCGSPDEACKFFEVDNLTDAYRKILEDIDGNVKKFNQYRKA